MAKTVVIRRLLATQLKMPLVALVESVNPGCMAHAADISVFGYGRNDAEAVEVLKQGIERICPGEEFPDLRATVHRMVLSENPIAGQGREAQTITAQGGAP
jgi:hypothetical protein